jgi:hypothetical protein
VDRSVAQGDPPDPTADASADVDAGRWLAVAIGVGLVLVALAVYTSTVMDRYYNHFVWQAAAFLEGQVAIRYPDPANEFFQDVLPVAPIDGVPRGLLPFPPLPALLLVPFVAAWGLATEDQTLFAILGALVVGICWWFLGRLPIRASVRLGTTILFAFGTVFWYTAQLSTTWFQAHVVAVGLTMLALGIALGGHGRSAGPGPEASGLVNRVREAIVLDRRQLLAGFLFGLACTARLPVVFGAPFFLLVGSGGSWWRRGWSAGVGAAIPVLALVAYNLATTGHFLHPAYEHLYQLEALVYQPLGYNADWAIEDVRYIPQNIAIMFGALPDLFPSVLPDSLGVSATPVCTAPDAVRGLFDVACPLAVPRDIGMSVILTSPAFLLAVPALRRLVADRIVAGAAIAVVLIAILNLMHFSQGWVQFGYRFSNDFVPWLLLLVALGWDRAAGRRFMMPLAVGLIVASIAINLWGVVWGGLLGW